MTELGFDVEKEGNRALAVVRNREFWTKLAREVQVDNLRVLKVFAKRFGLVNRVGPRDEKSSNLHITADSTGSIHKNARGKKFDPKKVRLGWGNLS